MPCLDRFFGIEIEYRVVGPDDGFNPPGFVSEHQMNARRRRRQLRIDRARERVDKLGPTRSIEPQRRERKSVGEGRRVAVRVELGGRRAMKNIKMKVCETVD